MSQAIEPVDGGVNGVRVTVAGVTVLDGTTYQLPDGEAVRAFVHLPAPAQVPSVMVTLHTAEEWAMDDLPCYTLNRGGRVMRQNWSAPAHPTGWTAADLGLGNNAAWDAAIRQFGAEPWLPIDRLPTDTKARRSTPRRVEDGGTGRETSGWPAVPHAGRPERSTRHVPA